MGLIQKKHSSLKFDARRDGLEMEMMTGGAVRSEKFNGSHVLNRRLDVKRTIERFHVVLN